MISRNIYILSLIFLLTGAVSCQTKKNLSADTETNLESEEYLIKGEFQKFEIDNLGDIYLVNGQNEILKYNSDLELLFKNSFYKYGSIAHIDVSNPQKILVYFSDFQFVLFLDNTLSEIKNLSLEDLGYWDITAVSLSTDSQIWIYDPVNFKLIKINDSGRVLLSSNEQYFGDQEQELTLFAWENEVFLYSENKIITFSDFGQLIKTTQINSSNLQFLDKFTLIQNENRLVGIDRELENIKDEYINLMSFSKTITDFHLVGNQLYVLDSNGLYLNITDFSN